MVQMLQGADCYRLVFNDLERAVDLLLRLAERAA